MKANSIILPCLSLMLALGVVQTARAGQLPPEEGQRPSQAVPLVIGESFTIDSKGLGEKRRINVYLPTDYTKSPTVRLPVLYLIDGGLAEDFLHIAGLLQVSIGNRTMRPFILVGIENTERRRDLTGPTDVASDKKIASRIGGSARFRTFLREELMPNVKARYRTTSETAIVGESLAGLFVMETFLLEPELFDTYIAFDPSLWWNNQTLAKSAMDRLSKRPARKQSLYFASSDHPETIRILQSLAATLTKAAPPGLTWHYEPMPAETHDTIFHPGTLKALRHVFRPAAAKKP